MKTHPPIIVTTLAVLAGAFLGASIRAAPLPTAESAARMPAIERGRYLVHRASMCVDCHTPRDEKGAPIQARLLAGAPLGFAPAGPMPWSPIAPRIAGLPAGFTRDDTVHFLMTGERPKGRPSPLPPMPRYRFDQADAEAITAYLESLAAAGG